MWEQIDGVKWKDTEFVLRQIMNGITKVMAKVGEHKIFGMKQQGGVRSPKKLKSVSVRIKALTKMTWYSYQM